MGSAGVSGSFVCLAFILGCSTAGAEKVRSPVQGTPQVQMSTSKREALYLTRQASICNSGMETEKALKLCNAAIAKDSTCYEAYLLRAQVYRGVPDIKAALSDLATVVSNTKTADQKLYAGALRERAKVWYATKNYDKALQDLDQIRAPSKMTDGMLSFRADCHMQMNKPELAAEDLTLALQKRPGVERLLTARAKAYYRSHQLEKALNDYNRVIAMDKLDSGSLGSLPEIYLNRAAVYDLMGKKELAALDRRQARLSEKTNFENAPFRSDFGRAPQR